MPRPTPIVFAEGFKKTVTSPVPSGNKEPIPNPADKVGDACLAGRPLPMLSAPTSPQTVHDANVADAHVDEKNSSKHDQENKVGFRGNGRHWLLG